MAKIFCFLNILKVEKRKRFERQKTDQICVLLKHSDLKQKEIAKKLNVSVQVVIALKKKLQFGKTIDSSRVESCESKGITTLRL